MQMSITVRKFFPAVLRVGDCVLVRGTKNLTYNFLTKITMLLVGLLIPWGSDKNEPTPESCGRSRSGNDTDEVGYGRYGGPRRCKD